MTPLTPTQLAALVDCYEDHLRVVRYPVDSGDWRVPASVVSSLAHALLHAQARVVCLEEALREAWPYVPDHHGPVQHQIREALGQPDVKEML